MAASPALPQLALARFQSVKGSPPIDLEVHFNPATLQYTIQNTVREQGSGGQRKQHVSQSTAKLTMDLVFDTTDTGVDVRTVTDQMAQLMKPVPPEKAPRIVKFGWGLYSFQGLVDQFRETLEFFSATGAPLRSSINLTMSSQDVTFESAHNDPTGVGGDVSPEPVTVPTRDTGPHPSPAQVANDLGDPRVARAIAAANGEQSVRFGSAKGLSIESGLAGARSAFGASAGISIDASVTLAPAAAFSAGASIGGGASIGVGAAAGGAFGGLRASAGAGVPIPDPRSLVEPRSTVSLGPGVKFGPGGRALSAPTGASLSADVGVNADLAARLSFSS